jgi:protein-S-isoprenylcysteine O-methyltransferase Ste14
VQHFRAVIVLGGATALLAVAYGVRVAVRVVSRRRNPKSAEGSLTATRPNEGDRDRPGVIAPPPIIYLGFLAVGAILEAVTSISYPPAFSSLTAPIGVALLVCGLALGIAGARSLRAAGTNIPTALPTTALVAEGPYRWSRNPLYLAMTLLYAGIAILAESVWALVLLGPLLMVIRYAVILREESYLEEKFGQTYREYKSRVRRWI